MGYKGLNKGSGNDLQKTDTNYPRPLISTPCWLYIIHLYFAFFFSLLYNSYIGSAKLVTLLGPATGLRKL